MTMVSHKLVNRLMPAMKITLWCSFSIACIIYGLREHAHLFVRVQQIIDNPSQWERQQLRVGGIVVEQSIRQTSAGIQFSVRDHLNKDPRAVTVHYAGIPPALFKEGKAMVANGQFKKGQFFASEILAKHDENYQIPEMTLDARNSN